MKQRSLFDFDSSLNEALRESQEQSIARRVSSCTRCPLHEERVRPVLGSPTSAKLAFIGEAPSQYDETHSTLFGGKAKRVVEWMLEELNLTREEVFFDNAVKCRPKGNRPPDYAEEISLCRPYLEEQLRVAEPWIILAVGTSAAKALLKTPQNAASLRGEWLHWKRIPLRVTFHPAYLRRAPGARRLVKEDLDIIGKRLDQMAKMRGEA